MVSKGLTYSSVSLEPLTPWQAGGQAQGGSESHCPDAESEAEREEVTQHSDPAKLTDSLLVELGWAS